MLTLSAWRIDTYLMRWSHSTNLNAQGDQKEVQFSSVTQSCDFWVVSKMDSTFSNSINMYGIVFLKSIAKNTGTMFVWQMHIIEKFIVSRMFSYEHISEFLHNILSVSS